MKLYSQIDSAYHKRLLPKSKLTIHDFGCFLCSIATLGQSDPVAMLSVPGGFADGGLLVPGVMAKYCGMTYVGPTTVAPKGWCIGRTGFYGGDHFLLVNVDTQEMVDPLKYPANVSRLTYPINQYRVFTDVKFSTATPPPSFEAPGEPPIPEWAAKVVQKAKEKGITTPMTQTIGNMPVYQLLALVEKFTK